MILHRFISYAVVATLFTLLVTVHSQSQGCTTIEGGSGQCINIRECPSQLALLKEAQSGNGGNSLALLRRSICSFRNNVPFVCCPPAPPPPPPPPPRTNPSLLPTRCGIRGLVDRIVSGENAPLLAWPWIALLEAVGLNGRTSLVCGGVLISERYVLTAAHCVDSAATGFRVQAVRLGEHTIGQTPDCEGRVCAPPFQRISVEGDPIIHEQYGSPFGCSRCNDIALLRLSQTVQFHNLHVQPICLPVDIQTDLGRDFTTPDLRVWVAGWGTTDPGSNQITNILQQVSLPFNRTLCSLDLGVYPDPNMVLCAGGEKKDTCRGDSGGPMVMGNLAETKNYVVGIVSKGPRICGATNTGGLYTNVNHYVPWILQNLRP